MDVNQKYTSLLNEQIAKIGKECRYLEFKSNYQEVDKLGRYISALSNGACLDHKDFAYLYFGVDDETLEIKGTTFDCARMKAVGNEALELYLRRMVVPKVNFSIIEFMYEGKLRVVLFKIPAAVNEPTTYKQKPYIRVDSHVTDLTPYVDWMRQIYTSQIDWSAQIVEDATLDDLDPEAIQLARAGYKLRYPDFAEAVETWDDATFLDKAHLTQDGLITRTALLLVGKSEKVHKLYHISQIVWKCYQDGEVFGDIYTIPYIKATTALMSRIRNYRFKIYPQDSLIPAEVWKYDTRSILEGLHNCIAHQDYTLRQRINFVENPGFLYYANGGSFIPGTLENALATNGPQRFFRNACLCKAMVHFNMIDTVSRGIKKMFTEQMERRFPMPDYEIDNEKKEVAVRIYGNAINERYTKLLKDNDTLTLHDCISLDAIQKGHRIDDEIAQDLLKRGLIEGEAPNYIISLGVAKASRQLPQYTKAKGLDKARLKQMVLQLLQNAGKDGARREIIYEYLKDLLPSNKSQEQQLRYLGRLLVEMNEERTIERIGLRWLLSSSSDRKQP